MYLKAPLLLPKTDRSFHCNGPTHKLPPKQSQLLKQLPEPNISFAYLRWSSILSETFFFVQAELPVALVRIEFLVAVVD